MANIKVCDRCGKMIAVNCDKSIPFDSGQCSRFFNKMGTATFLSYDLCGKCDDELAEFLKKKENYEVCRD